MVSTDGYGWLEADFSWLTQACCVTLVAGGEEEVDVLGRFGAGPGGLARGRLGELGTRFPAGAPVAAARQVAGGVLVVEPNGEFAG